MTSAYDPLAFDAATVPAEQRARLAWRLRTIMADADLRGAGWHASEHPQLAETARVEYMRGELLGLVAQLEGARSLRSLG